MNEPETPNKLDYYSGRGQQEETVLFTVSFLVGVVGGIVAAAAAGFLLLAIGIEPPKQGNNSFVCWGAAAVVFVLLFVILIVRGYAPDPQRRSRSARFALLGFLIGCGVGCLFEGLCFDAIEKI